MNCTDTKNLYAKIDTTFERIIRKYKTISKMSEGCEFIEEIEKQIDDLYNQAMSAMEALNEARKSEGFIFTA